jgi:cytochrome c biogenesis protein CcmG, thiol:disulfide interchange protein DsbE
MRGNKGKAGKGRKKAGSAIMAGLFWRVHSMCTRALCATFLGALSILLASSVSAAPAAGQSHLQAWPSTLGRPTLALTSQDGKQWDLKQLRGKVVVLNFWASWCGPCVEELPVLNKVAADAGDGLVVLGVNYREASWSVERFMHEHAFGYPVLLDKSGEQFKRWTSGVMPATILIDRAGKPRWRIAGAIAPDDQRFHDALGKLLAE